ncbi:uncharacterized protein isoform X1 [Macaca fascicularis]|uniref:uncharacterized protein isoform X1 n=1 Tax=Macaca fascicularis TaxID=9541 RepID=UPI0032B0847C
MGCILTCCIDSSCGCCRGEEEPCYESDTYEAVAAATSESTTIEPGKLDVGATEGHDLQHISNQKMLTGSPEDSLSLKSLPPNEEDNDDAQILPSPIQGSSEENLNLVCPPPSEADDWDEDDYIIEILPLSDQVCPEDGLFLRGSPQRKDEEEEKEDDDDNNDVQGTAWNENDLTLESLSDEETHPVCPEDGLFLRGSPQRKDEEEKDDDDNNDVQITAWNENDLTLESLSDEETHPVCPEDDLFLRGSPQRKDEEEEKEDDDDDDDVQGTAWNENDLTLESISDEETYPG